MEIIIADVCGLCAGCKYAINTAKQELEKGKSVTIFKEIVHNQNVNQMLKTLGAKFEEDISNLNSNDTIIIRAHGEPPQTYKYLKELHIEFKDCTCINVAKIHKEVENFYNKGYTIVILGKHKENLHPEVLGTLGWANNNAILIEDEEDLIKLKNVKNKIYLVCQTTFNINKANILIEEIEKIAKENDIELIVNKSICAANKVISSYAKELAENSDVMIVVGGKNSSNTKELYNNIKQIKPTIFIDDINACKKEFETKGISINNATKIGITAGASTMKEELEQLKTLLNKEYNKN